MRYSILLVVLGLVFIRVGFSLQTPSEGSLVIISGAVTSLSAKEGKTFLRIGRYRVSLNESVSLNPGDWVSIQGVYQDEYIKEAEVVNYSRRPVITDNLRSKIVSFFSNTLHEPHAAVVSGVLLGSNSLNRDFKNKLLESGTYHLVVASGSNISIVAACVFGVVILALPRQVALSLVILVVWLYSALTGLDAPIVRAASMVTILYALQIMGRTIKSYWALIISCLLMIVVNPLWLWDVGFYLSSVATLSIILFEPLIYRLIPKKEGFLSYIAKLFSVSIAAQIGVLPVIFLLFHELKIIGVLTTVLVSWTTGPIIAISATASGLWLIFPPLGSLLLYIVYPFTYWFVLVVKFFS